MAARQVVQATMVAAAALLVLMGQVKLASVVPRQAQLPAAVAAVQMVVQQVRLDKRRMVALAAMDRQAVAVEPAQHPARRLKSAQTVVVVVADSLQQIKAVQKAAPMKSLHG